MRPFVSAEEMREIDSRTIQKIGGDSFALMEKVTDEMTEVFSHDEHLTNGSILILTGPGNNGGDGWRLGEKLRVKDRNVSVAEILPAKSADCVRAKKMYAGNLVERAKLPKADIIVDAIFGNLARASLPAEVSSALKIVNGFSAYRVALDLPTGIDTQTGEFSPNTFDSDLTLSIGYPREVFTFESVAEYLGRVQFIGNFFESPKNPKLFALELADFAFRRLKRTAHKSEFGKCGLIGGSAETPGAILLAAEAAHRVGAGYSTVFFAKSGKNLSLKKIQDASFILRREWKPAEIQKQTSIVIGCGGLPNHYRPYSTYSGPTVVDADALAEWGKKKIRPKGRCVLTPHPGEAARILQAKTSDVQKHRLGALTQLVEKTNQSVYLKGAPGLLAFPGAEKYYVNLSMNPVFAKAGSGDILSGIMGGFLAQRPNEFESCIFSALLFQGAVGEVLREKRASIAADQLEVFSKAFQNLKKAE